MNVLLFCPMLRIEPETLNSIFYLQWSKGALDLMMTRDNAYGAPHLNVMYAYAKAREACLKGKYDALFIVESDIIIPPDALEKLSEVDADVVNGVYMWRVGEPLISAYRYTPDDGGWPDISYSKLPSELKSLWGKTVRTSGLGFGCCLIHRRVLEEVGVRTVEKAWCDWWFYVDVNRKGFVVKHDFSVLCGHKGEQGRIYWPSPNEKFRIEYSAEPSVNYGLVGSGEPGKLWDAVPAVPRKRIYIGNGEKVPGVTRGDMTEDQWYDAHPMARSIAEPLYRWEDENGKKVG